MILQSFSWRMSQMLYIGTRQNYGTAKRKYQPVESSMEDLSIMTI